MKIVFFDFGAFTCNDIEEYFRSKNIEFIEYKYWFLDKNEDEYFMEEFRKLLSSKLYDFVFSVNYFPLIAECCKIYNVKYISWCYDNPLNVIDIERTLGYETNYVFMFDRLQAEGFISRGFNNVYHLPLATNTKRLDKFVLSKNDYDKYKSDVSFVGQLYKSNIEKFYCGMNEYQRGYVEGAINAQTDLYGMSIIDKLITETFVDGLVINGKDERVVKIIHSSLKYAINAEITRKERIDLLTRLSNLCEVKLYSNEESSILKNVTYMGECDYFNEMPKVFKASKINLNINLKASQSGISLRVLDILGAKGFVLSSWQPEIAEFFVDGEDVVQYESFEDAVAKADYYLKNDILRERIATNGHKKVAECFTYDYCFQKIFAIAKIAI